MPVSRKLKKMKFYLFIIELLRKISKSFVKKQNILLRLKIYSKWKKVNGTDNIDWDENIELNETPETKIAVCIVFFYTEKKIVHLKKVCSELINISKKVDLTIITNTSKKENIIKLEQLLNTELIKVDIINVKNLIHPYLLPWCHTEIMKKKFEDKSFTHFLFTEDDILVLPKNIFYWIKARKSLKKFNLIPSFIRYEKNKLNVKYSLDIRNKIKIKYTPRVFSNKNNIAFINTVLPPFQGMYFYDRELMDEYLNGSAISPDYGFFSSEIRDAYLIRERASMGLTHYNVPEGFYNRYVFPVSLKEKSVKDYCLLHHLPNKYADDSSEPFGKTLLSELIK